MEATALQAANARIAEQSERIAELYRSEKSSFLSLKGNGDALVDANARAERAEARIVAQANDWRIAYNELAAERDAMREALENLVEAMSHHGTVMHAYVWRAHIEARAVLAGGKLVELPAEQQILCNDLELSRNCLTLVGSRYRLTDRISQRTSAYENSNLAGEQGLY
jgi:hypothetical protein